MSHSILRVSRVKNFNDVMGLMKHIERTAKEYANIDIDKFKSEMNYNLIDFALENYNERIKARIEEGFNRKRKIRSDAVRLVDGLITSDEKFFKGMDQDEIKAFFENSLEFIKTEYGEENIVYATVHLDEKTPHMHFGFVPLTEDGRLSAKDVLGNKKSLSILQDKYNGFVNHHGYELERGERAIDTKRKHKAMNIYKDETNYHKKELDKVQAAYEIELEKWEKAKNLSIQEEKKEFETIIVAPGEEIMPDVDIPSGVFKKINPEQVGSLRKWGKGAIKLIKNQQKSMETKDKEIERLHDLVRVQNKDVEGRVDAAMASERRELRSRHQSTINYATRLEDELQELGKRVEELEEENSLLKRWKKSVQEFIKENSLREHFEKFLNRFHDRTGNKKNENTR